MNVLFADESELRVGVCGKAVDCNHDGHTKLAHILNVARVTQKEIRNTDMDRKKKEKENKRESE